MPSEIDAKVDAIERLLAMFKWERATYLGVTCLALAMLLIAAGALLVRHQADVEILAPLFGSSGLITFSLGRLLRMWDQAIRLISGQQQAVKE